MQWVIDKSVIICYIIEVLSRTIHFQGDLMVTAAPLIEKIEKPAPSTIALRDGRTIFLALTMTSFPELLWSIPVSGGHSEPDAVCRGKKIMNRITDVCIGSAILHSHRLVSVCHRDVSYDGKRRDKFIFELVPAAEYKVVPRDHELLTEAFIVLSECLVHEAFNEGMVYDNGVRGVCVELRGQAQRKNAKKSFVIV